MKMVEFKYLPFGFTWPWIFDYLYISYFATLVGFKELVDSLLVSPKVKTIDEDGAVLTFGVLLLLFYGNIE